MEKTEKVKVATTWLEILLTFTILCILCFILGARCLSTTNTVDTAFTAAPVDMCPRTPFNLAPVYAMGTACT